MTNERTDGRTESHLAFFAGAIPPQGPPVVGNSWEWSWYRTDAPTFEVVLREKRQVEEVAQQLRSQEGYRLLGFGDCLRLGIECSSIGKTAAKEKQRIFTQ